MIPDHLDKALEALQAPAVPLHRILSMPGKVTREHRAWIVNETPKVFLQLRGAITIRFPGGKQHLSAGEVAVFGPEIPHREHDLQDPRNTTLVVNFRFGCMQVIVTGQSAQARRTGTADRCHLNPAFRPAALEIMRLLTNPACPLPDATATLLLRGFLELLREAYRSRDRQEPTYPRLVGDALKTIQENVSDASLTVHRLAAELGCSAEHLSRLFSQSMSQTVKHYLIQERLRLAEHLLRARPDLTVSEVAYMSGFASPAYFCTVFRKHNGTSPGTFR